MQDRYQQLIDKLIAEKHIPDPSIAEAFRSSRRRLFLRPHHRLFDGIDSPLPIGKEQTISQPQVVAFMLRLLDPQQGQNVLEIGYGSGWQTSILAYILLSDKDQSGHIHAYEIISELASFGKKNLQKALPTELLPYIHLYNDDYEKSFMKHAPYDRIISGAAFDTTPKSLINALPSSGILVYPTSSHEIRKITKTSEHTFDEDVYPGFIFVPITHRPSKNKTSRNSR